MRLDFTQTRGPQFGKHRRFGAVPVDSVQNIGSDKIAAILGRTEMKDFVDLYVLLQTGCKFSELYEHAREKDAGLEPFWLAQTMREVAALETLPDLVTPLDVGAMKQYYLDLADSILRGLDLERAAS